MEIALISAWAQVGCGDQCEAGRELHLPEHARHHEMPVFDGLAERLGGVPAELGELIKEQPHSAQCSEMSPKVIGHPCGKAVKL